MERFANENRPDLALALGTELGGNTRYLAPEIFAPYTTTERGGTDAFAQVVENNGGTLGVNPSASIGGAHNGSKDVSWSTTGYIGRSYMGDADVKDCGGIENAALAGAKVARAGVVKQVEAAAAAVVFDAASVADAVELTSANPFEGLMEAIDSVADYGDAPTLVCSQKFFRRLVSNKEVKKTLEATTIAQGLASVPQALRTIAANWGLADVKVGRDSYWAASGAEGTSLSAAPIAAVINLPEVDGDAKIDAKMEPRYGRMPTFLPDGEAIYSIDTSWNTDKRQNVVDCVEWCQPLEINAGAKKIIALP